jgi:Glycosyl hydrolase family 63 C-terminal domain
VYSLVAVGSHTNVHQTPWHMPDRSTAEHRRLTESEARKADWKNWGPYVSERAWGTVREDYSPNGEAWEYFPHTHSRSRAYRWNEDGIGGFCNRFQNLCLGVALWNGRDPILKERFFGVTGKEGNHGEDVKEYYFYLDNTPTHSYAKMLYKYPQAVYPYGPLVEESYRRNRHQPEFELYDALKATFRDNRYFDVFIEYAKVDDEDLFCRITAINRSPEAAPLHLLPHIWYRNTWTWKTGRERPRLAADVEAPAAAVRCDSRHLGERFWYVQGPGGSRPTLMFTENESNIERLYGVPNPMPHVKDAFHDAVVQGDRSRVNPALEGTKAAAHCRMILAPGQEVQVLVRFSPHRQAEPFAGVDALFDLRIAEADAFYATVHRPGMSEDERRVQRQAFAGLLWSKQFYHYSVELWLDGDENGPPPPEARKYGRNETWRHLYNLDVISMPDKWEYPWYAAWDLAFHMLPIAQIDPEWAKRQLILMMREWYMHPNGQLPAYEWALGDVNPPVHAWAVWQVYRIDRQVTGEADGEFLEKAFHKLLLNFTWWVNRKDRDGRNVFQGGFLGLDNIGVFDRSKPLPTGGHLDQADGTAWMGMYALNMLMIALELARTRPAYEDVATKFFEHFVYIANAINGSSGHGLWNTEDGFYYDVLHFSTGEHLPLRIRSFVGLIPLFAVEVLDLELLDHLPRFKQRVEWFINYRGHMMKNLSLLGENEGPGWMLSLVNRTQLARILTRMLDPRQFLADYGLRALSREHRDHPFTFTVDGQTYAVSYEPAESTTGLFGGNSNWRGPIWFPVNYLMIEALRTFGQFYGDSFQVEMPTGSGVMMRIDEAADAIARRLTQIFLADESGRRPFAGDNEQFQTDPHWRDHLLFYEYFNGDNGAGLGASHQTGWTALVAQLLQEVAALSPSREEEGQPDDAQSLLPISSL